MDRNGATKLIDEHFAAAGHDEQLAARIYSEDVVIEWPQSGERIRGKANVVALHEAAQTAIDIEVLRTRGCDDLWVTEATIRYDGAQPTLAVFLMEFREGRVVREIDYFGAPFEPPAYRAQWVERMVSDRSTPS
jgi:hypothetical protein